MLCIVVETTDPSKEKLARKAEGGQHEQLRDTNADSGEASPLGTFSKDGVHAGFF